MAHSGFLVCLVLAFALVATGNPVNNGDTSFEKFFDAVIKAVVKKKMDLIEPYHVEDLLVVLQPEVHSHKLPPKLVTKATNVTLYGVSTIHRSGHAKADLKKDSRVTEAQMAAGPLHATSNLEISVFGLRLRPKIAIDISNFDFTVKIFGNKTAERLKTVDFKINKLEDLKVTVTSCKWTDKWENLILKRVVPLLEKKIRSEVEQAVKGHLDDKLQQLPEDLKRLLYG